MSKYTEQLINHLGQVDAENDYLIYFGNGPHPPDFAAAPNFRLKPSRFNTEKPTVRIAWEQAIAPFRLLGDHPAVLHCPVNVMPLTALCPTVITILDLGFMRFPERYKAAKRRYLYAMTKLSTRRAAHIITISESVRREVIELLKVAPSKVTAIPLGVASNMRPLPSDEVTEWRKAHNLPERFVMYLGTLEPRKNLPLLLKAFAQWRQAEPQAAEGVKLVLGGGKGWLYEEIFQLVESLALQSVTIFPGYIAEEDLPLWYNSAQGFVYPSVYEGFGLPPLEAMACGCPVITSNTSSLPEVVGEAGIMVGPADVAGLAAALHRILTDHSEHARLRAAGLLQATRFSWRETARQTRQIYQHVANQRP